jgi:hypothetical protein
VATTGQSPNAPLGIADRFNPFGAQYLADPYPPLSEAREATPAFYSADLHHWRYAPIRMFARILVGAFIVLTHEGEIYA